MFVTLCKLHQEKRKEGRECGRVGEKEKERKINHFVLELENLKNEFESPLVFATNDFTDFIMFLLGHHGLRL